MAKLTNASDSAEIQKTRIEAKYNLEEYVKSLKLQLLLYVPIEPDKGVVWYDENGKDIGRLDISKGAKIKTTKEIKIPRFVLANDENHYRYIYSKMFNASNLKDTPFDREVFRREFPKLLDKLIERYKSKNDDVQTYPILSAAKQLSEYILSMNVNDDLTNSQVCKKNNAKEQNLIPEKFEDIFTDPSKIHQYIDALIKTDPPLLSETREFIGKPKGHKGVICSWIWDLRSRSIIKQNISRANLALVLNNEIREFNMGNDGKTISNTSSLYARFFKDQLFKLTEIHP